MRSPRHAVAIARPQREISPEVILGDDVVRRIESSCPGDTFMPPVSVGNPATVIARWVSEAESTGEKDPYLGKRQHPRFTWNVVVLIRVRTGALAGKVIRARARNVSLGGMGVQVRSQLEAETLVDVSIEGRPHSVCARVVHCTKAMTGNLLGVNFQPGQ